MRVLHIVEAFGGGVLTFLQGLINGLDGCYENIILYARRDNTPENPEMLFREGTKLICSKHLTRELNPGDDIAAYFEIRRLVREIQPNIVHLHSSKAGAIGRWAINGKRLPVFYTPNGYSFLMENCGKVKPHLYFLFEKLCGYRKSITIACGKSECEQGKRVTKDITYVSNGVNTEELDRFVPAGLPPSNEVNICTVARITKQKNPEMFNNIAKAFPGVRFTWIGDGEMREMLTSPNIEITGWLSREEAIPRMLESTVFLLPSRWEGLSLSLVEAMYFKRLCVVSRIPGNVDAIQDGETGFVCGTYEEYVQIINGLLERGIDKAMLDRARERVEKELNQQVMAEKYGQLYKDEMTHVNNNKSQRGGVNTTCG